MIELTTSRRGLIRGLLVFGAGLALPKAALAIDTRPLLTGDGIADDTAAIQALLDGKPFRFVGDAERIFVGDENGGTALIGGAYRLTGTVTRKGIWPPVLFQDVYFVWDAPGSYGPVFSFEHGSST